MMEGAFTRKLLACISCLGYRKGEKGAGQKTFEAQLAGTRDQTKDSKLRVTYRSLAKQSGKNDAIILVK